MDGSLNSTWVTDWIFLSGNAFYSGPIILLLSLAIVLLAIHKKAAGTAAVFLFFFLLVSIAMIANHFLLESLSHKSYYSTFSLIYRHLSQLLRIFPYLFVLWLLIKPRKK